MIQNFSYSGVEELGRCTGVLNVTENACFFLNCNPWWYFICMYHIIFMDNIHVFNWFKGFSSLDVLFLLTIYLLKIPIRWQWLSKCIDDQTYNKQGQTVHKSEEVVK